MTVTTIITITIQINNRAYWNNFNDMTISLHAQ